MIYKEYFLLGNIEIEAVNMMPNNKYIILHLASNVFYEDPAVFIKSYDTQLNVKAIFPYSNNDYLIIELVEGLTLRSVIVIKMQFERKFDSNLENGFILTNYIDSDGLSK